MLGGTRIQRWVSTYLNQTSTHPTRSYHNCRRCPHLQDLCVHNICKSLSVAGASFPPASPMLLRRCRSDATQTLMQSPDITLEHVCLLIPRLLGLALPSTAVSLRNASSSSFFSLFLCRFCPLISHLISLSGWLSWLRRLGYPW